MILHHLDISRTTTVEYGKVRTEHLKEIFDVINGKVNFIEPCFLSENQYATDWSRFKRTPHIRMHLKLNVLPSFIIILCADS